MLLTGTVFAETEIVTAGTESQVKFHGFAWGTTMQDFIKKAGKPVHQDKINGYDSLVYNNLFINGYPTYMVVFFANNKLEGGSYYFDTQSNAEREQCYLEMQEYLKGLYGVPRLYDPIFSEKAPYESTWKYDSGFVKLLIDTRRNDPVTIWYSSPAMTKKISG